VQVPPKSFAALWTKFTAEATTSVLCTIDKFPGMSPSLFDAKQSFIMLRRARVIRKSIAPAHAHAAGRASKAQL
jgi:hypothetical protein